MTHPSYEKRQLGKLKMEAGRGRKGGEGRGRQGRAGQGRVGQEGQALGKAELTPSWRALTNARRVEMCLWPAPMGPDESLKMKNKQK